MTDAPERIWAGTYAGKTDAGYWQTVNDVWGGVEYVRADTAAARLAEVQAERDALRVELNALRVEAEKAFGADEEIAEAWDAIGTRGNPQVLSLAEQISSIIRELDAAIGAQAALDRVRSEAREPLEAKLANVISHATMGGMSDPNASLNDIGVEITRLRNELYVDAREAALREGLSTALIEIKGIPMLSLPSEEFQRGMAAAYGAIAQRLALIGGVA